MRCPGINYLSCSQKTELPEVDEKPAPVIKVLPGYNMSCSAKGARPICTAITWNATVLMNTTAVYAKTQVNEQGNYTCLGTNKYGTDRAEVTVIFAGREDRIFSFIISSVVVYIVVWIAIGCSKHTKHFDTNCKNIGANATFKFLSWSFALKNYTCLCENLNGLNF